MTDGEHVSAPVLQGDGFVSHEAPALQLAHSPVRHTLPASQTVPSRALSESMQIETPVLHEVVPVRHGAPGFCEQATSAVQAGTGHVS